MSVVDLAWHSLVSTSGCPTSGATRISTSAAHRHPASPPRHPCFTSLCRCHRTAPTSAGTPSPAGHNCGGTLAGGAALAVLGGWAAAVAAVLAGGPPRRLCAAGPGAPPRPALPPLVCACMTPLSSPDMPHCTNSSSSSSWRLGQGPLQPRLPGSPCSPVVPHPDAGAGWCGGPHAPAGGPVPTGGTGGGGGGLGSRGRLSARVEASLCHRHAPQLLAAGQPGQCPSHIRPASPVCRRQSRCSRCCPRLQYSAQLTVYTIKERGHRPHAMRSTRLPCRR